MLECRARRAGREGWRKRANLTFVRGGAPYFARPHPTPSSPAPPGRARPGPLAPGPLGGAPLGPSPRARPRLPRIHSESSAPAASSVTSPPAVGDELAFALGVAADAAALIVAGAGRDVVREKERADLV